MPAGRKPPIMPPRNPLASTTTLIGKRPPPLFKAALQKARETARARKAGAVVHREFSAASNDRSQRLPFDARAAARTALTGAQSTVEAGRAKARRKVIDAQERVADQFRAAEAAGEADALADIASAQAAQKPVYRQPQARYATLKNERPS